LSVVLTTGTNGYIGSKIVESLLEKDHKNIGIDLHAGDIQYLIANPNFEFFEADITNAGAVPDNAKEADILIHCAALVHKKSTDLSRENYFRVNYEGTKNILNFLDKDRLKQIIFLSTVSVYGDISKNTPPDENMSTSPEDYYGESKLSAESEIKEFSEKHHIPYTIFRLVPVYGDTFLLNINKRIYLPRKMAFYKINGGEQCLSLLSVNNVVDVVATCINNPSFYNEIFIVKDIKDYSINEIISTFRGVYLQKYKPVFRIPLFIPETVFKLLGLVIPDRAKFYKYQLKKIADDNIYSGSKLFLTGIKLKWNLKNTLKNSSLFMADK
jgi:UDP-glucose 4-epimerase